MRARLYTKRTKVVVNVLVGSHVLASSCTNDPSHYEKIHPHSILQVPTTQLAKMSIDPKFVELTADVLEIFL